MDELGLDAYLHERRCVCAGVESFVACIGPLRLGGANFSSVSSIMAVAACVCDAQRPVGEDGSGMGEVGCENGRWGTQCNETCISCGDLHRGDAR